MKKSDFVRSVTHLYKMLGASDEHINEMLNNTPVPDIIKDVGYLCFMYLDISSSSLITFAAYCNVRHCAKELYKHGVLQFDKEEDNK
jgi:hypothetical protein